ncbi:hypothetical protein J7F03_11400 [Streptomyces sp. ISL-43]|uniref:hypothetical protein n=1 Tax=Streptomyces sp. ISL-43 TaxID=2819183 RepID=UPI001BE56668|nr:hypothetical protein [Streptomyces sp. ISL-43]MBT2447671.1 hypothetical protein [Streptomyces sp. ISL-43]
MTPSTWPPATYSIHGDFFNAWDDTALGQRVKDCVASMEKAGSEQLALLDATHAG